MTFERPLRKLAADLAESHGISDPRVLDAMARIPRQAFLEGALRERAYADEALPIGFGQTISKPSTVARMTEALALQPGDKVLEVGTGSGYQAAILACLADRVYTVERIAALAARARGTLARLGMFHVEVRAGDGTLGWSQAAPYQGILVAAAADQVPPALLDQLDLGGRLVIPVRDRSGQRLRRVVRIEKARWKEELLEPCRFVPLLGEG